MHINYVWCMYITDFGLTTYQTISALFIHEAEALNQACTGCRPACALFLKIDPVRIVGMCVLVCVSAPEAITN